ncbi:hypothetical protein L596_019271 [Steinernema carpocapsae]|uniref:Uncharacterized protein n=1 Tax=Steinernema carpocapsae TaxID=34508 RepID=A0A4U5MQ19_STECR|nr:hypothetical protein L596_019271 [Steinernema carpocapsae]
MFRNIKEDPFLLFVERSMQEEVNRNSVQEDPKPVNDEEGVQKATPTSSLQEESFREDPLMETDEVQDVSAVEEDPEDFAAITEVMEQIEQQLLSKTEELKNLQQRYDSLYEENGKNLLDNANLHKALDARRVTVDGLERMKDELDVKNACLKHDLTATLATVEQRDLKITKLEDSLEKLDQTISCLEEKLSKAEQREYELETEILENEERIDDLKSRNANMQQMLEETFKMRENEELLKQENEDLKAYLKSLQTKADGVLEQLVSRETEILNLEKKLAESSAVVSDLKREMVEREAKAEEATEELEKLRKEKKERAEADTRLMAKRAALKIRVSKIVKSAQS